jgi:hypothetical protein
MKIDAITRERIVMVLDIFGWEQDGKGPTFIHVGGNGERKTFKNWQEAMDFSRSTAKAV